MTKTLLVTGSSGLIGSDVCTHFARELGWAVHGVDNNQRAVFFGVEGDTRWTQQRLVRELRGFQHHELDIRDRAAMRELLATVRPSAIVHAAAQSSHDRAAAIPFDDFDTNAVGTLNLLEAARHACPEAPFIHMSTNKVYGDGPNRIAMRELATRYDEQHRTGDHICYYSDLRKARAHFPQWEIALPLEETAAQIVTAWQHRLTPRI